VVDDDPAVRDLLRRHLERNGYRVETAVGGEDALRLARGMRPDVITLDVLMPEMDGWALLALLKSDPSLAQIPVIMITVVDERRVGFSLGASDYLGKPVDRDQLLAVLRKHCPGIPQIRVLVVEDDHATREVMRRNLERENWHVLEAENGRIALQLLEETLPDIILLDLMMPEMDGFEFLDNIRREPRWREIPVIVVTAKTLTDEDRQRLNGCVEKLIEKGEHIEALLSSLNDMLDTLAGQPVSGQPGD
jgi:hypothetical protein